MWCEKSALSPLEKRCSATTVTSLTTTIISLMVMRWIAGPAIATIP
jgi:hypothetical protein